MKKIYWLIFVTLGLLACAEDNGLGKIPSLTSEYTLPQGNSPADERIVDLHDKYGTYVLYDYTEADLKWVQVDINSTWNSYEYTEPDPQYAGNVLDLLEECWFKFYPAEFHGKFMPYKIFLTSTLKYVDSYSGTTTIMNTRVVQTQMVVGHCTEGVKDMSQADKIAFKNDLQSKLWGSWLSRFDIPAEFYAVSNYNGKANANPSDWNYARERGFVADSKGAEWSTVDPYPAKTLNVNADLDSFLSGMRNRTSEEWAEDLTYPLVKKKYDILRNYFLKNFNFDIQEIGDANVVTE